jgi:hypothetical protein
MTTTLRTLLDARGLVMNALREIHPSIADEIDARIREAEAARWKEALTAVPDRIRGMVESIDVGELVGDVVEALRGKLIALGVDGDHVEVLVKHARDCELGQRLQPDQPIGDHPTVAAYIATAQVKEIAEIADLPTPAADALAKVASTPRALDRAKLAQLVTAGALSDAQAKDLGFSSTLYQLAEHDTKLATAIRHAAFPKLAGKQPRSTADLARLDADDWRQFLATHEVSLPAGASTESAADALAGRLAALHPTTALIGRLPAVDAGRLGQDLALLAPLYARNRRVVGADFEKLDAQDVRSSTELQAAHQRLRKIDRAYPGLAVASMLDDPELDSRKRVETVARRAALVEQLGANLDGIQVLELDLSAASADIAKLGLDKLAADGAEQRMVLSLLQAYQRAWGLTRDPGDALALVGAGFSSALSVARLPLSTFRDQSGLSASKSKEVWEQARTSLTDVSQIAGAIVDTYHGPFRYFPVRNHLPSASAYLASLPGFQELFGKLSFCSCEECRSILGPAAYFVDLMKFIDENLRAQVPAGSPLDLRARRPDLWTLELSCDNTNDRIPTLQIVAEIFENFIAQRLGYTGSLADRAAIRTWVYQRTLATREDSFRQPFHFPLARIAHYLAALGTTHGSVAALTGALPSACALAELGLSPRAHALVITPTADLTRLGRIYGFRLDGSSRVDAAVLGQAMGLSRAELGSLVATRVVGPRSVTITPGRRDVTSIQNDVEWVNGLSAAALDRMHRFTRLLRQTRWTISELDEVLTALGATALESVEGAARLQALQARFSVATDDLCALVGRLPQALLDRRFNSPSPGTGGALPQDTTPFIHPAFRDAPTAQQDAILPRLLTAIGVNIGGLGTLATHLASRLAQGTASPGFDPRAADESARFFLLSLDNLTLLYRHARLARLLDVSIDDLFQLLELIGLDCVSGLSDLDALLRVHDWWRTSGYQLDEIAIATGRTPRDATRHLDPVAAAGELVTAAARGLTFTETIFSVALGATEQASQDLLASLSATVVERVGADGSWQMVPGVDLDAVRLALPPTATVTEAEVKGALRPYLASELLARRLGSMLGFSSDKVVSLALLARQVLSADPIVRALRGDGPIDPLIALVAALRPLAVTLAAPVWDVPAIDFLRTRSQAFGAGELPGAGSSVTLAQLQSLSVYRRLAQSASGSDLREVLGSFDPATQAFSATESLVRVLGVSHGLVLGLRGQVTLPALAAAALDQLDRAAKLAVSLGIDGATLGGLMSADYDRLESSAGALITAYGSRFADAGMSAAKVDEAEQPVREAQRDALADYLIRSVQDGTGRPLWKTLDELYQHFLIDVSSGGCSTTSRVVSATMSAQLYVHRVIMNLEISRSGDVAVRFTSDATAAEWSWRKNYRVWQANRKVFLWPENYLDPDLRDDKTPLFNTLEQELLQTDIDDQSVTDALTKYLAGFEELASLKIAGAYHDKSSDPAAAIGDVLHLFGVTASDPPVYYYRTCQNLLASGRDLNVAAMWSPWRKITVQITGRRVSPIVHEGRLHLFWVDIKTQPVNRIEGGASKFVGYKHKLSLKLTTLRPDGTWTAPQDIQLPAGRPSAFGPSAGQVDDLLIFGAIPQLDPLRREHLNAVDDYSLSGPSWDWVWPWASPSALQLQLRNFRENVEIDLFGRSARHIGPSPSLDVRLLCAKTTGGSKQLFYGIPSIAPGIGTVTGNVVGFANVVIDDHRLQVNREGSGFDLSAVMQSGLDVGPIATLPASTELLAVPGSVEDGLLQVGNDMLLLQGSVNDGGDYVVRRIGTTLLREVTRRLFNGGVQSVLDTATQYELREAGLPISLSPSGIVDQSNAGQLDFAGPYGGYYRELFFDIPFLIANALSSRGRFEAAQRWYHYIFDPTSTDTDNIDLSVPPEELAHRMLDRVWRYREFRGLGVESLRQTLTDTRTLTAYQANPFNPWAVARYRISAFQKTIVMKYVGNLLDWADVLFKQFTMESVNEAMMLYIMAADVLGARPAELGDCGTTTTHVTYAQLAPALDGSHEILVELETWARGARLAQAAATISSSASSYYLDPAAVLRAVERRPLVPSAKAANGTAIFQGAAWSEARVSSWSPALDNAVQPAWRTDFAGPAVFGWSIIRQLSTAFCVPINPDLLALWDRIEDRLFKIRHCTDIDGNRHDLALFAPPIDPRQLVAMRAAGLTLEEVLGAGNGDLPPYRFLYLIDRAKAFAGSLSGYGAALLSALEKKDAEELNRLRLTQQMNLTHLVTQTRQLDIAAANESLEALRRQREAALYRKEFYTQRIQENRNALEIAESIARHGASSIYVIESILQFLGGFAGLVPQVGAPTAMKYGGVELNKGIVGFANSLSATAKTAEAVAASMSLEANFARRSEGWAQQRDLADFDIRALDRQITAAEIRLEIANQTLVQHQESLDQLDEFLELTDGKFTNLGLYTWLSRTLQSLYRGAYQNALALARLAEQAFRFERGDLTSPGLVSSYWQPENAGLLAGDKLLLDLQTLERRFIETNYRTLEVDQAFALSQIDAAALMDLRETGECTFTLGEAFFDIFYPGHYKRRIKSVRVTIPTITGPYVNVSATLDLLGSQIRTSPTGPLVAVPPTRSVSVATSTAQNDAGVFELSFRDERYMPFEGLGAVESQWHLVLPRSFRQFDYQTINDVILSISYTAEQDGVLRNRVEGRIAGIESSIVSYFRSNSTRRLFSLRQDFSSAFTRLVRSPTGTAIRFEISDRNFPLFFRGRALRITNSALLLRTSLDQSALEGALADFSLTFDGTTLGPAPNPFSLPAPGTADPLFGGLPFSDHLPRGADPRGTARTSREYTIMLDAAGGLAPASPAPGDLSAIDAAKLLDILLYLEYTLV